MWLAKPVLDWEELQTQGVRAEVDMAVGAAEGLESRLPVVLGERVITEAVEAVEVGMGVVEAEGTAISRATMEEAVVEVRLMLIRHARPMWFTLRVHALATARSRLLIFLQLHRSTPLCQSYPVFPGRERF